MNPTAITVISREDIEASGANTIPDLLRLVPGMDVVVASSFFTAINSRLYWNYENVMYLVLVDGREANVELLGQPPFEIQPFGIDDIEKIEVIRGPGSSLYGANAVAGVISITTRPTGDLPGASVRLGFGEVGHVSASARAAARFGDFGLSLSGGVDRQNTFTKPRREGKDVWKFRALVDYRHGFDHGPAGLAVALSLLDGIGNGNKVVPADIPGCTPFPIP